MQAISPKDRLSLEAFFRILMLKDGGAYVLFGSKPVAFTAYSNSTDENICLYRFSRFGRENKIIKDGWIVWKKYAPLFHSDRFILESKELDDHWTEICLIDNRRCNQVVEKNAADFKAILGNETTPEILLQKYQTGNRALFHHLHDHHALLGMLLGFGTTNSWLFHQNTALRFDDPHAIPKTPFKRIRSSPTRFRNTNLKGIFEEKNHRKCYKFLYLPNFLADLNSEETRTLQTQYLEQQSEIHQAYAHGNFLEVTLRRFTD